MSRTLASTAGAWSLGLLFLACGGGSNGDPVTEDQTRPTVRILSGTEAASSGAYQLEFEALDDTAVVEVGYVVDGGLAVDLPPRQGSQSVSLVLAESPAEVQVFALDAAGNRGEASVEVRWLPSSTSFAVTLAVEGDQVVHAPVVFTAAVSNAPPSGQLSYTWRMGDGTTYEGAETTRVAHLFRQAQTYEVEVTVAASETNEETVARQAVVISNELPPQGTSALYIEVLDEALGPLPGVEVSLAGGEMLGTTDLAGVVEATVSRGFPVRLSLRREGWMEQLRVLRIPADEDQTAVVVQMLREGDTTLLFEAQAGGTVQSGDVRVVFPADAFVDEDGEAVTGDVALTITPIDPEARPDAVPSGFEALDAPGGEVRPVFLYGLANVELHQDGREVHLAPGTSAELTLPLGAAAAQETSIPLFSLDPESGLWIPDGEGTVQVDAGRTVLRAEVSHFSWWTSGVFGRYRVTRYDPLVQGQLLALPQPALILGSWTSRDQSGGTVSGRFARSYSGGGVTVAIPAASSASLQIYVPSADLFGEDVFDTTMIQSSEEIELSDLTDPERETDLGRGGQADYDTNPLEQLLNYRLTGEEGDLFEIRLDSVDAAGTLFMFSETNATVSSRRFGAGDSVVFHHFLRQAGTYRFGVRSPEGGSATILAQLVTQPSLELDQPEAVQLVDDGTREWVFWANEGSTVHVHATGDLPFSVFDVLRTSGAPRPWQPGPGEQVSQLYQIDRTGLHVLRVDVDDAVTAPRDFTLTVSFVPPVVFLASADGKARVSFPVLPPGAIRRVSMIAGPDMPMLARPSVTSGDGVPTTYTQTPSGFRIGTRSIAEGEGSFVLVAGAPAQRLNNFALFYREGGVGSFDVAVERLAPASAYTVGDGCPDSDTNQLRLAAEAIQREGLITLCPGRHEALDGINPRSLGVSIVGPGSEETTVKAWANRRAFAGVLAAIEGLTVDSTSSSAQLDLSVDRAVASGLRLSDLVVAQNSPSNRFATGVNVGSFGTSMAGDGVEIHNVRCAGALLDCLVLSDVQGFEIDGLEADDLAGTGLTLTGCGNGEIRNFSFLEVASGIEANVGFNTSNIYEDGEIRLSDAIGIGMAIAENSRNGQPLGTTTVRSVSITTGAENDLGIDVRVGRSGSEVVVEQTRIVGVDRRTRGVNVDRAVPGPSGRFRFVNNLIVGVGSYGILFDRAASHEALEVLNNTFVTDPVQTGPIRAVVATYATVPVESNLVVANNIFRMNGLSGQTAVSANQELPITAGHNLFSEVTTPYRSGALLGALRSSDVTGDPEFDAPGFGLLASSPAIDAADPTLAPTVDVDGNPRPQGTGPDIGAFER